MIDGKKTKSMKSETGDGNNVELPELDVFGARE